MALFVYVLATLVITYPVPFRLRSVLAGFYGRDGWQYTWWLWFSKQLLMEGRGLADLYLLNHPVGLSHPFQWSLIYLSLVAFPLGMLFSTATVFNLMVLASLILSGLSAYHLCRELVDNHWAAVVGGAIFAFAPNRLGHTMAGWLPQMTVYLFPWYALVLIRTLRKPTLRRSVLLGLLTGVAASSYVMHIAYIMLPLTLVIVGAYLIRLRRRFFEQYRARYLALAGGLSLLVVLPFVFPLILERFRGASDYLVITGIVQHSTDLLAFFTPSPYHPILAPLGLVPSFASRVFEDAETMRWSLAYVGLVPTLLSLWGVLRSKPRPWVWVVLALGAAIFALGPLLVVGGAPFEYEVDGSSAPVLLPYALVREIPLLDWGRTPGRINVVGMLAVGVLAAHGTARLLSRLSQRRLWQGLSALVLVVLILFEFLPLWPFPSGDATAPPVIQHIASQPGDGAVLNLPMQHRRVNHRSLYFQTFTERPIVGGVVHRWMPETVPWWETIQGLVVEDVLADAVPRPDNAQRQGWLRHFDVDWVLFHRVVGGDEAHYRPFLDELLGEALEEDETLVAYAVPDEPPELEETLLYTFSEQGWRLPESDGGLWRRWMYDEGSLYIYSTLNQVGVLRFAVDSHLDLPTLEVHLQDSPLDTFVVGERTVYSTRPFTLSQGMNVLSFHTPGGCPDVLEDSRCWSDTLLSPAVVDSPPACDAQASCRSFVFDSVSFVPLGELSSGAAVKVNFGDQMLLRGWEVDPGPLRPGTTLEVSLYWAAAAELSEQHVVFVHVLSADGSLAAQYDEPPVGRLVPSSAWPTGAIFGYPAGIELPEDLQPGVYQLVVGVYLWPSLDRLPVVGNVPGAERTVLELGCVRVEQ